jgi:tRNA (cmo5U34)-methyltransferase
MKEYSEIDTVQPDGKWRFDDCVTQAFQDMLERSIPGYARMREIVFAVGSQFVQPKTEIVDLGCSRGEALEPFIQKFGAYNHYTAVDVSPPMLEACRNRFQGWIDNGRLDVTSMDLRNQYPPVIASLTMAILTIQFTPIEYRQRILYRIFQHTASNGAFIIVEKVLGDTAATDALITNCYYDHKLQQGYSDDQIQRKRLSLEGVLVPLTAHENERMLRAVGFKMVECIWRNLNFCAWVAIHD